MQPGYLSSIITPDHVNGYSFNKYRTVLVVKSFKNGGHQVFSIINLDQTFIEHVGIIHEDIYERHIIKSIQGGAIPADLRQWDNYHICVYLQGEFNLWSTDWKKQKKLLINSRIDGSDTKAVTSKNLISRYEGDLVMALKKRGHKSNSFVLKLLLTRHNLLATRIIIGLHRTLGRGAKQRRHKKIILRQTKKGAASQYLQAAQAALPPSDRRARPLDWPEPGMNTGGAEEYIAFSGRKEGKAKLTYRNWRKLKAPTIHSYNCIHGIHSLCVCKPAIKSRYRAWLGISSRQIVLKGTEGLFLTRARQSDPLHWPKPPNWPEKYIGRLGTNPEGMALTGVKCNGLNYLIWFATTGRFLKNSHVTGCHCSKCAGKRYVAWATGTINIDL